MFRLTFGFIFSLLLVVQAAQLHAEAPKNDEMDEKKRAEIIKRNDDAKTSLNGSEWEITIKPSAKVSKSDLPSTDTITFQDNRFKSKYMMEEGFNPTNYTVTSNEDEKVPVVWETMQSGGEGKIVFWRGEWNKEKNAMTGSIVRNLEEGNEDYYFSSATSTKIAPTSEEKTETEVKEVSKRPTVLGATEPAPVTTEKKKKGWF